MNITEEKVAYEKHQEEYRQQKEIERLKDICAYCGYLQTGRKYVVKPYPYGENGETIYLCEEGTFSCSYEYRKANGFFDPKILLFS